MRRVLIFFEGRDAMRLAFTAIRAADRSGPAGVVAVPMLITAPVGVSSLASEGQFVSLEKIDESWRYRS